MKKEQWKKRLASRSDWTSKVYHLTKPQIINGGKRNYIEVLLKIIEDRKLIGSTTESGFICGETSAVCFQDTPIYSLAQNVYYEESEKKEKKGISERYLGCGLMLSKFDVFKKGGRPVVYDITSDAKKYLPATEWWRIVKFDLNDSNNIIDWTHEREWRIKGDYSFKLEEVSIILPNNGAMKHFIKLYKKKFSSDPLEDLAGIIVLGDVFF